GLEAYRPRQQDGAEQVVRDHAADEDPELRAQALLGHALVRVLEPAVLGDLRRHAGQVDVAADRQQGEAPLGAAPPPPEDHRPDPDAERPDRHAHGAGVQVVGQLVDDDGAGQYQYERYGCEHRTSRGGQRPGKYGRRAPGPPSSTAQGRDHVGLADDADEAAGGVDDAQAA